MRRPCLHLDCPTQAVVRVRGGVEPGRRELGWLGHYCVPHALEVVDAQLFQAVNGLPIHIEAIR